MFLSEIISTGVLIFQILLCVLHVCAYVSVYEHPKWRTVAYALVQCRANEAHLEAIGVG